MSSAGMNWDKVESRQWRTAWDGHRYESFNGAIFGEPGTQSYRMHCKNDDGDEVVVEICVPDSLMPPSTHRTTQAQLDRRGVMAELERQNAIDKQRKEEGLARYKGLLTTRMRALVEKVSEQKRGPSVKEFEEFEAVAKAMLKAGFAPTEIAAHHAVMHQHSDGSHLRESKDMLDVAQSIVDNESDPPSVRCCSVTLTRASSS